MYDLSGVPGFWLVIRRSRVVELRALWHLAASETAGTATGDYLHTAPSRPTPLRGTHGGKNKNFMPGNPVPLSETGKGSREGPGRVSGDLRER